MPDARWNDPRAYDDLDRVDGRRRVYGERDRDDHDPRYVGRVESPDYGVSTQGDFEPLVDEATFYRPRQSSTVASWRPVHVNGTIRTSRCADSCAAICAVARSPAAGRRGATGTTPTATVSVSVAL